MDIKDILKGLWAGIKGLIRGRAYKPLKTTISDKDPEQWEALCDTPRCRKAQRDLDTIRNAIIALCTRFHIQETARNVLAILVAGLWSTAAGLAASAAAAAATFFGIPAAIVLWAAAAVVTAAAIAMSIALGVAQSRLDDIEAQYFGAVGSFKDAVASVYSQCEGFCVEDVELPECW